MEAAKKKRDKVKGYRRSMEKFVIATRTMKIADLPMRPRITRSQYRPSLNASF